MMIHCDYSAVNFAPITHPKITKHIGVSKYVCDVFTNITGKKAEVCYNPVYIDIPEVEKKKDKLHIIYAGRLTSEKQGWLIDKFVEKMNKSKIDYDLTIYSNRNINIQRDNVIIKEPKLDLTKEMAEASYMLITSKAEAFCLSAVESLMLGTPLICTDLPVFKEIGIDDTNSIKIDTTLKNFKPNELLKEFDFKYTPPKDNWEKYLDYKKPYTYDPNKDIKVKVLKRKLYDVFKGRHYKKDDTYITTTIRACYLEAKGYVEICD